MSEARARYGEPTGLDQSSDTGLLVSRPAPAGTPVFAFLAFTSGSHEGAIIHHMRLANAFHERGFKVVVYWMMDRIPSLVARGIPQRVLMRSLRYLPSRPSSLLEGASRIFDIFSQRTRRRFAYNHPGLVSRLLRNFLAEMCEEDADPALVDRLERLMAADGVTHLLPTFAMSCPLARAARLRGRHRFEFLVTFQGEEIFANYVENGRPLEDYYRQLRRAVDASPWPAATVSADYARRLQEEIGIDLHRMTPLYPGVELPAPGDPPPSFERLTAAMPNLRTDLPIVAYFGRQDPEKGIDLLLYAARMLQERGHRFQLVVCGGASFGKHYHDVCRQIAQHLRLDVSWQRHTSDEVRAALYAHSRCIVYPSIHREPFGMVAPEAMAHGTPVLVPEHGGITEAVGIAGKTGGLTFRAWDSRDLATQLERLLADDALHARLAADAPAVARHFSVDAMADRTLEHLGLPLRP